MKSEQGVTLTSLVIYIAVATVLISTMAVMSSHFFANIQLVKNQSDYVVEYNNVADIARMFLADTIKEINSFDYAEKYRNLPYIGILKPEVYNK